ncbi:uncharacterized protein LOC129725626 [Wyeomyia smithii]|uniref:uncharacterized protein LOC129725626 n=1 Tax=Wyeomyia smithii TaxID=174621 RepID=UPI0024681D78|nr:uncharacterized protein LOC129725626 [Wyeomyia smithii]
MQRIALAIDLDEPSLCEYIVDGVTDDEYHRSMLYDANTIKKLKDKLLTYEKTKSKCNTKCQVDERTKRDRPTKVEEKKPKLKTDARRYCFNCGKPTHVASECPQKGEDPKCFSCNGYGHLSKECDKKNEERSVKKKNAKVNTIEKVTNQQPSINVKINDCELRAIVDTGSEISLLRKDLWLHIENNGAKLELSDMKVRGFGGQVKTVCG